MKICKQLKIVLVNTFAPRFILHFSSSCVGPQEAVQEPYDSGSLALWILGRLSQ